MAKKGPKIPKPKVAPKLARNARGRPAIVVNWELIDYLASIKCTSEEIAGACGCDHETLRRKWATLNPGILFEHYLDEKRSLGRASLRRKQFEVAQSGNVTMLIWLGKQLLDQKDRQDVTSGDAPLPSGDVVRKVVIVLPSNGREVA